MQHRRERLSETASLKFGGVIMKDFGDRRIHPRMKARWPVTILSDRGPVEGQTVNLGATGAYIECEGEFRQNEVYWMLIGLDKQSVVVNGKALRLNRETGSEGGHVHGIGVEFQM
jgi:hypothetical protein